MDRAPAPGLLDQTATGRPTDQPPEYAGIENRISKN